jgi:protein-tyrosine phosphatase
MEYSWITAKDRRMAIVPRPRGEDWLFDDLRALKDNGVDLLVSLLTPQESLELGLTREAQHCSDLGINFLTFPIPDRSVPPSMADFSKFVQRVAFELDAGRTLGIHCRAGIGRSSVLAASLLLRYGYRPDAAFEAIASSRGCSVPDTPEQRAWVARWAGMLSAPLTSTP